MDKIPSIVLAAVLATIIWSISLLILLPTSSYSATSFFVIYSSYSFPIYLVSGLIFTYIIDYIGRRISKKRYFYYLTLYIFAGCIVMAAFGIIYGGLSYSIDEWARLFIFGALATFLYYHSLITIRIIRRVSVFT